MSKISLIVIVTVFLSACGFHTPHQSSTLNAVVSSTENNIFAKTLKKHFNQTTTQALRVQIGAEAQTQQTASYTSDNQVKSYTLSLSVPIKIFNHTKKPLMSQELTAKTHLSKLSVIQADRLQIEEGYQQLRNTLIKRLLRRLSKLNAN